MKNTVVHPQRFYCIRQRHVTVFDVKILHVSPRFKADLYQRDVNVHENVFSLKTFVRP